MLEQILKDSPYKLSQFAAKEINAVEEKIYPKSNGKYYMKCQIRDKEIQLKPEEIIRQLFIYKLLNIYGYEGRQIKVEHGINFGREVKRADIVIFEKDHPNVEYIIVEVKKPKLKDGKEQLRSYCNATGATMGVWTNGDSISYYHRKDPNYFESIQNIPRANQKLKDILTERWTIENLITNDKLAVENKSLANLIVELEDEVLANAGVDVFEEIFKLIFTKLYDEKMSANDKSRVLEFRNYGETDSDLKDTVQTLFDKAKDKWQGVFAQDDRIKLTPSHLAICISSLQDVKLFNSNLEVIDDAFEYLMSKSQKGEKGQYFTPRYVIDMCVKMLNPKANESMIDTAAGSCGFPVHTIFHVWKSFGDNELFTAEDKPPEFADYVNKNIFAIDFDEKAVRVARTLNLIAGDGKTNVLHLNTLDYERWDEIIDEDWRDIYYDGWKGLKKLRAGKKSNRDFNFDILMANPPFAGDIKERRIIDKYNLGKNSAGKYQSKVGRDILFIERNLQFLKSGGRMAIILPQGRFNNSSDKYIRDFISEHCRILAIVGLHGNVFKPHTGTKTSVLFVQKWDDKLCPRRDDYPIFFATMRKPSKDNSGDKIYVKDETGKELRDKHNHLIVDHDLFNHEGLTHDGIAEAFAEFAKKEKLSFFDSSSFNEQHYRRLLEELECTEILLSEVKQEKNFRLDAEPYRKNKIKSADIQYELLQNLTIVNPSKAEVTKTKITVSFIPMAYLGAGLILKKDEVLYSDYSKGYTYFAKNDIIIAKITPCMEHGKCAIARNLKNEIGLGSTEYNIFRVNSDLINTEYLFVYLNRDEIRNKAKDNFIGTSGRQRVDIQFYLNLKIPIPSKNFQIKIADIVKSAHKNFESADETYRAAEKLLAQELHLEDFKPSTKNTAVVSFSAFMQAGRLDAEYFMPKYDDIENKLASEFKIKDKFKLIKTTCDRTKDFYDYIEIGDVNVSNGVATSNLIATEDLPDNAKIMTKAGDVLVSKVRPNRGAVAVLTENNLLVSGAFSVLRECGDFSKNVLQVLLRLKVYRELMLRFNVGSSYPVIKDEDVLNLPLPKIDAATQTEIAALVEKSFALRAESGRLLELAKQAVEMAIEQGENAAVAFVNESLYNAGV